jgi:Raf kinase inhibitor-like YbhB/YbcL family protein
MHRIKSESTMWRAVLIAGTLVMTATAYAADEVKPTGGFALTSPDVAQGRKMAAAQIFNSFGCTGQNVSPALNWSHAPQGTQSFALLVHDPDAPTGSGWWHWVVYNIPANASALPAGAGDPKARSLPAGALQGRTDFGTYAYGGPCPPPGKVHHYRFRLFALKVPKLDVPSDATAALISFNVRANAIGEAELVATYSR